MARKNVVKSFKMLDNASLASPLTSTIVNVINMDKASIHLAWSGVSGAPVLEVQARNGEDDSWYALDLSNTITLATASGDAQILLLELPFTDIRLQTTAGAGIINATISMKQVGG